MAIRPMFLEIKNAAGPCFHGKITGGIAVPGGIRTHDLPLRSSEEFYSSSSGKAINCQEL